LLALEQEAVSDPEPIGRWVQILAGWGDDVLDAIEAAAAQVALDRLRASSEVGHQALVRDYEAQFGAPEGTNPEGVIDHLMLAVESPDETSTAGDVCGWFLVSRTLFAKREERHLSRAEFLESAADHIAALAEAMGDRVRVTIRDRVIALALR
jgi:hypothetical protein